jgi:hypothetical protein
VCSALWAARSDLHRAGGPGGASDERLKVNSEEQGSNGISVLVLNGNDLAIYLNVELTR